MQQASTLERFNPFALMISHDHDHDDDDKLQLFYKDYDYQVPPAHKHDESTTMQPRCKGPILTLVLDLFCGEWAGWCWIKQRSTDSDAALASNPLATLNCSTLP